MSDLIKRKDGSYSPRGLWDNIRANKGSGKKPTKEMLKQEKKIKNLAEGGGIPERYKKMGFTHVGQKKEGDGQHKWKVLAKKGDSYKVVQGGYRGMKDFSQHHSEKRRSNFWNRMGGKNSAKANDPFSPLYWHKKLGKWEEGGKISHENDKEMVDGIADILQRVKDSNNRKEIANKMISDFKKENVNYNRKEFLNKSNLPKEQKGGVLDYVKKGISSFIDYVNPFESDEPAKPAAKVIPEKKPLFSDELRLRQSVMESHHRKDIATGKTVSKKGAKGLTQIMPNALVDFQRYNPGVKINLNKPEDAVKVQTWMLDHLSKRPYLNKPEQSDNVTRAKVLAAYNWGPGNMKKFLGKQKEAGVDIYKSLGWVDKLPEETRKYVQGILLNKLPEFQKQLKKDTLNSPYNKYYNFGRGGMLWFNQKGGSIVDPRGQWAHPGKVTTIPGNDITMKGVPYPVFAETDKKQQVIMQPEQEYHFPGAKSVTEYPMPTTHAYKISKYLLPQHKEGGTMEKFGNVPYDAADAHKKPLSNGLWALPFKNGGQLYGKSGIHIKPENRGKFTASANRAGMGVQAFASKVLANKEKYSPTLVKRANFARNAAKWKHQFGGSIDTLKMALGGQMGSPKARISTPLRTDRSSAAGMMNFTEDSSPKARMFEGGDFPNSTFGDKTIPAKSYKMGGHMLSRPDHWVQAGDAVQDLNKNPQQSWYGESNRAKATAPVFQGGVKKPLLGQSGIKMPMSKKLIPIIPPKLSEEQKRAKAEKFAEKSLNWNRTERRKNFGDSRLENMAEAGLKWFGGWKGLPLNLALKGNDINYNVNNSKGAPGFEFASQLANTLPNFPGNSKSVGERMSTAFGLLGPIALGGDAIQDNWIDNGTDNPILPFAPDRRHPSAMGVPMRYVRQARKRLKEERENKSTSAPEYRMGGRTKFSKMC